MLRIPVFAASAASAADQPPPPIAEVLLLRRRLAEIDQALRHLGAERETCIAGLARLERAASAGASPFRRALSAMDDPEHELDDPSFLSAAAQLAGGEAAGKA